MSKIAMILLFLSLMSCSSQELSSRDDANSESWGVTLVSTNTVISCIPTRHSNNPFMSAKMAADAFFVEQNAGVTISSTSTQTRTDVNGRVTKKENLEVKSEAFGYGKTLVEQQWTESGSTCLRVSSL